MKLYSLFPFFFYSRHEPVRIELQSNKMSKALTYLPRVDMVTTGGEEDVILLECVLS
jgi:hypothetical protein